MHTEFTEQDKLSREMVLLQQQLELAAEQQRWHEVRRLDSQLNQVLQRIRQAGLTEKFAAPIARLGTVYQRVLAQTRLEMASTEEHLSVINQCRQGMAAYQLTMDGRKS